MRQILTRWTVPQASGTITTVMNFDVLVDITLQRDALEDFWTAISGSLPTAVTWSIDQEGRELSPSTGELIGTWLDPRAMEGAGGAGDQSSVSNATQVLVQWHTGTIANGRFLRGRTFIPGFGAGSLLGGELLPAERAATIASATAFIASNAGLQVWSRPTGARPGQAAYVTRADVWNELAVLRGRRD